MRMRANTRCPCGYYGDSRRECTCSPTMIARYQKRLSGPLIDRIDLHLEVPRVEFEKLTDARLGEPSEAVRRRVEAARDRMADRFRGTTIRTHAEMGPAEVWRCTMLRRGRTSMERKRLGDFRYAARRSIVAIRLTGGT